MFLIEIGNEQIAFKNLPAHKFTFKMLYFDNCNISLEFQE